MWQYWGIFLWLIILGIPWIIIVHDELHKRTLRRQGLLFEQLWESSQSVIRQERWSDALRAVDRALALASENPGRESSLLFQRGHLLEQLSRPEEAITAYAVCQEAQRVTPTRGYRSLAAFRQGYLLVQLQRWEEAELCLRTSVKEAGRRQEYTLQLQALRILLGVYQALRKPAQVLGITRQAFQLAHAAGDDATQALIWDIEGDANLALGKLDEALDHYECSLDLLHRVGNRDAVRVVEQDIARLYQVSGEWEKAIRWLGILLREEELASNHGASARIAYDLACLYIHIDDLQQAAGYLQRSSGLYRQAEDSAGADLVGRTLVGLGILMHRQATANWLTFADIKRRSAKSNKGEE